MSRTRKNGERKVLFLAIAASTAVHALVLGLPLPSPVARPLDVAPGDPPTTPRGLEMIRILATDAALTPAEPPALRPPVPPTLPDPNRAPGAEHDRPTGEGRPSIGTTPGDALKPRLGDARLWGRIRPANVAGSAPAPDARGSLDPTVRPDLVDTWAFDSWTTTDGTGLRWGAAPGVLFIAGAAIPTCGGSFDASDCGFGLAPHRRDAYRQWLSALVGIRNQALQGEIAERQQAIRARRNAERSGIDLRRATIRR